MERKRILAAAGLLVPYYRGAEIRKGKLYEVFYQRVSRDGAGRHRNTALFICDKGVWDNGTKQVVKAGPVSVEWNEYYQRRHEDGSIVVVEDRPQTKASRGDAATRTRAGGES